MRDSSLTFLKDLISTPSPSGHEREIQKKWLAYTKPYADRTFSDAYGNCVAVFNEGGGPRVMLAAHADEISMSVNYIDDKGFIYVRKLGGIDAAITRAQRVLIHARGGAVDGVVANVAPHLTKSDKERKVPDIHDLFIDIGVTSRKEALKLVKIGDPITIDAGFKLLRNNFAVARAFDNRIGIFSVAETLRLLSEKRGKLNAEVLVVSNIMEEIGLLGARQIAYSLHPDLALVVDVTHATDYPTVDKIKHGDVKLGGGPSITHGSCNHPLMVERLEMVATQEKIEIQHEAISASSGTDTDVIFWTRGGIPSALVSLPNRYMHSPVEMIHLKDLFQIPQLLAAFVRSLKKGEQFRVAL